MFLLIRTMATAEMTELSTANSVGFTLALDSLVMEML